MTDSNLKIFYHIAAMNGWREVVMEQLNLLKRAGWTGDLNYSLLANQEENGFVHRAVVSAGMNPVCQGCFPNLALYEFPTLEALKKSADQSDAGGFHAYFHTKGVSQVGNWVSTMWRWQMNHDLFGVGIPDLLSNGHLPDFSESLGSSYIAHSGFSMYSGNFWLASNSHLKRLPTIDSYRSQCQPILSGPDRPHWFHERHPAETWIGEVPHRSSSVDGCQTPYWDHSLWANDTARQNKLHHFHTLA